MFVCRALKNKKVFVKVGSKEKLFGKTWKISWRNSNIFKFLKQLGFSAVLSKKEVLCYYFKHIIVMAINISRTTLY